jgi:amino acid adenylation domain-containing protein
LPPGARVGVAGAPGAAFLASLLAVWSEGHVVVPLDPALPAERAAAMCGQADVRAFVVTERVPDRWLARAAVIAVREDTIDLGAAPLEPGPVGEAGYVCFTSGSTGAPKGVLGAHRGLSQFVSWQRETFGVTPDDRVGQVTPPSFDVFFRESLLPLTTGASIVIPAAVDNATSGATLSWLNRAAISVLHAVPAMAQSWLDAEPGGAPLRALRIVFFAGEPLSRTLVARWRALAPGCRIVNLSGPTETTLAKCFHEVAAVPGRELVPIGCPMPGAQALILRGDRRCGIGEPGEIVIRTPYRSLGYLSDDSPERFVPNPFTGLEDDIVYRTGDRGRHAPDGTIEIDGRFDDAVKIRGVRVDPAEVAAVLTSHPAVRHAAVVADHGDGTSLVAYIACEAAPEPAALRRHVLDRLPAAAVPSRFVCLPALPRSANGKIDRAALATLAVAAAAPRAIEPPATPTERALAALWAEVLGTHEVGRSDDFFESGGHSLLAARLVARINQTFRLELSIGLVFEEPTLAALARAIDRTAAMPSPGNAPITRADRGRYKAGVV